MAKYVYVFGDGSPKVQTSELTDDQDAVAFAKIVAAEVGREGQKPAPEVTVFNADDGPVEAKSQPLMCARCADKQRLAGIERHENELCFTFICDDCKAQETRSVMSIAKN